MTDSPAFLQRTAMAAVSSMLQWPFTGSFDGLTQVRNRIALIPKLLRIVRQSCCTPLLLKKVKPVASICASQLASAPLTKVAACTGSGFKTELSACCAGRLSKAPSARAPKPTPDRLSISRRLTPWRVPSACVFINSPCDCLNFEGRLLPEYHASTMGPEAVSE